MGISLENLQVISLILLVGGFVFLLIEHINLKEWRDSVERRLKRVFHIVGESDGDDDHK